MSNTIQDLVDALYDKNFSLLSLLFNNTLRIKEDKFDLIFNIVKYDPIVTSKITQSACSAFFGYSQKKINVYVALNMLGINKVINVLENFFFVSFLKPIKDRELFKQNCIHALGVAIYAKLLAPNLNLDENEMFMAGLMHDIGKLAFYVAMPDKYEEAIKMTSEKFITIGDAEKDFLSFDHCELGKLVLRKWGYPEIFVDIVALHHNLESVKEQPVLYKQLQCIEASNILCNLSKIGNVKAIRTMRFELLDKKNKDCLKGADIPILMFKAKEELVKLQSLFNI